MAEAAKDNVLPLDDRFIERADVARRPSPVARGNIPKQARGRFSTETPDIGVDALTAVDKSYEHEQPYWFTGNLHTVRFDFGEGAELTPQERFEQFLTLD